jgi:hypothetical protein
MIAGDLIETKDTIYYHNSKQRIKRIGVIVYLFDSFGVPKARCWLSELGYMDLYTTQFKLLEEQC